VYHDAVVGRKRDDTRRRIDHRRYNSQDLAGSALIHGLAVTENSDAKHPTPGIHSADDDGNPRAWKSRQYVARDAVKGSQLRQQIMRAGDQIELLVYILASLPD
jgi:hypothetical protein